MPQEVPHDTPGLVWQHDLLTSPLIEIVPSLIEQLGRTLVLHPPSPLDS